MQKQKCHQKPVKLRVQTNDVVYRIADGSNTDCRCVSCDGYISDSNIAQAVALLLRISLHNFVLSWKKRLLIGGQ